MIEAMKRCNMNAEAALNHLLERGTCISLSLCAHSCAYVHVDPFMVPNILCCIPVIPLHDSMIYTLV